MKNTERLPKDILNILRYMKAGHEKDKSRDEVINSMTPNELFKEVLSYHGIESCNNIVKHAFMAIYGINDRRNRRTRNL